jgi:hypothetical protein
VRPDVYNGQKFKTRAIRAKCISHVVIGALHSGITIIINTIA